jgi:hypothetical protein
LEASLRTVEFLDEADGEAVVHNLAGTAIHLTAGGEAE